jgi:hypothetical protein
MKRSFFAVLSGIIIAAIICCSEPKPAKGSTNNPTLGGCVSCSEFNADLSCKTCALSAHPTVIQPLTAIDLKTSTVLYGLQAVSPGLCYGLTYQPSAWYASGVAVCLNTARTMAGNTVFPSAVTQLLRWGVAGVGAMCSDNYSTAKDRLVCHGLLMFGANLPIE